MQTIQLTTHIENNAEVKLSLPAEYANQEGELVVIIQSKKAASNISNDMEKSKALQTEGEKVLEVLKNTGYLASMPDNENLSENYKQYLDWSHKI